MDWLQIVTIVLANIGLFLWSRTESRADYREINQILREMKDEMKDFHSRLLILEERYLKNVGK